MIGGGARGSARPPVTVASFGVSRAMIAAADSDGAVRSSNGFSETITKAALGWE